MKKILIIFMTFFMSLSAVAGSDLKVKTGSASFLKEKATAILVLDFSAAKWEHDKTFAEEAGEDYDVHVASATSNFVEAFNGNSQGLQVQTTADGGKYKMVFHVSNLERHQAFTGSWGQRKYSVTGVLEVTDVQDGSVICKIFVDGFGQGKDYTMKDGIGKCFKGLGKALSKLK